VNQKFFGEMEIGRRKWRGEKNRRTGRRGGEEGGRWREVGEYIEEGMTWERILREMSEWRVEKESGERNGEK